MGVSKKIGVLQSGWFIMEDPIKMDDLGYHYFRKHPYMPAKNATIFHLFTFQLEDPWDHPGLLGDDRIGHVPDTCGIHGAHSVDRLHIDWYW